MSSIANVLKTLELKVSSGDDKAHLKRFVFCSEFEWQQMANGEQYEWCR